ncbi:MAG: hypothetical protein Q8N23_34275 [Archangium sp.]|nr:hypothetical protein [Archangium sp.]MDP3571250.1 hypothetical protein [Archangium sp.]
MSKRILTIVATALLFTGCVKEISSDDRLDRETKRSEALTSSTAGDLVKMKCDDITSELSKARDDSAPEEKRIGIYTDLFDQVKDRTAKFEDALSRNPDLAYQEGSQEIIAARDGCIQSQADVRLDFEGLVREIINLPVVDEYRDGKPVKAARLSFDTLRSAIEKLALDDKDSLLTRLSNAEKTVEVKDTKRKRDK